jgi:imidazolonepropionase-like amidohydrolase
MYKVLLTVIFAACSFTVVAQKGTMVINNVHVISMTADTVYRNQQVILQKGKIAGMRPMYMVNILKGAIDGRGQYLMPALYDMHIHWPADGKALQYFRLCTVAGIGTVRMMKSEPEALTFRKNNRHRNDLPQQIIGYPIYPTDSLKVEQAATLAETVKSKGYDFIKIFGLSRPEIYPALLRSAQHDGLALCGHALGNLAAKDVLNSGYRSVEHVGYFDKLHGNALDSLIAVARMNGTYVCPTLDWANMVYHSYPKSDLPKRAGYAEGVALYQKVWDSAYAATEKELGGDLKRYADFMTQNVQQKMDVLKKLYQAGIPLLAGSDAEEPYQAPGFTLVEELLLMQKAGLSNFELLKTATVNAAAYFKKPQLTGTVEKGSAGAMILLDKNPLEDIRNLTTVRYMIKNGQVIDCAALLRSMMP